MGNKKTFLKFFCYLGSISCIGLYWFDLENIYLGLFFYFMALISFWASLVFYNAYLPEVAHPEQQDRASAKGFMYGYFGSVLLLILNLLMIQKPDWFGISSGMASRISFVLVGLWWIGFAQITFKRLPDDIFEKKPEKDYIWKGFRELKIVSKEIANYPTLKMFLISFFLLSIGVQTIILMAAIFGSSELGLPAMNLIVTILLVQIVAIFGAFVFSRLSEKWGNIKALKLTIIIWMLVCFTAFLLDKNQENVAYYFYGLGGLLGFVQGAIQSLTRSTYSKLLPETEDHATYFSFYDVTEKIAIVLGTFVYGFLFAITDSMQWSVLCMAIFFLASFIVLNSLKKTKYVR
jgi:UMF1 family MFS transporter